MSKSKNSKYFQDDYSETDRKFKDWKDKSSKRERKRLKRAVQLGDIDAIKDIED